MPQTAIFAWCHPYSTECPGRKNGLSTIPISHLQFAQYLMEKDSPFLICQQTILWILKMKIHIMLELNHLNPQHHKILILFLIYPQQTYIGLHNELSDLIRDLDLSKKKAEILASRLQQWNLLQENVKISAYRDATRI